MARTRPGLRVRLNWRTGSPELADRRLLDNFYNKQSKHYSSFYKAVFRQHNINDQSALKLGVIRAGRARKGRDSRWRERQAAMEHMKVCNLSYMIVRSIA